MQVSDGRTFTPTDGRTFAHMRMGALVDGRTFAHVWAHIQMGAHANFSATSVWAHMRTL